MSDPRRETTSAYDAYAEEYAEITRAGHPLTREVLARFAGAVGPGAKVLEIASGPGWDADFLEEQGVTVVRTDVSQTFIALQARRSRTVRRLDLVSDDLGGPWDGMVALYVLQHVGRTELSVVLRRMAGALRPGGLLLTSIQEGEGDHVERGANAGVFHVTQWPSASIPGLVGGAGLEQVWSESFQGSHARWTILIARRP